MKPETRVGTVVAIALHLGLAGFVGLLVMISPLISRDEEPLVIMELVAFPDDAPVTMGENQSPGGGGDSGGAASEPEPIIEVSAPPVQEALAVPDIPTLERLEVPPVPDPVPEPPTPAPAPVQTPTPTPAPQPTRQPAPRPQPQPQPQQPKIVNINEFRRQHGQPRQQPARPQPARRTVVAPSVSSSNLRVEVPSVSSGGSGRSGGSVGSQNTGGPGGGGAFGPLQENYLNRIHRILDSAWSRPVHLPKGLSAEVEFRVGLEGRIALTRIVRNSGNSEFDDTVRQAFQNAARAPAPPNGQPFVSRVAFRLD